MAKEFSVSRSIEIAAPPERITPLLTDLRAWQQWSPWAMSTSVGVGVSIGDPCL